MLIGLQVYLLLKDGNFAGFLRLAGGWPAASPRSFKISRPCCGSTGVTDSGLPLRRFP
jgi:hypothetical protein